MHGIADLHGGERISALQEDYADQDRESYVPKADNIAPRRKNWKASKSNTQMPPIQGKVSGYVSLLERLPYF